MKPELGPGFLRNPPRGWIPARARVVAREVSHWPGSEGTGSLSQSCRLDAEWEIQLEGQDPYRFQDAKRHAPLWCMRGGLGGKRFYQVRLNSSHGLQGDVDIPLYVNPKNREDIWVDWDAAYDAHVEAWERINRIDLAKARRSGKVEGFFHKVVNPFARDLREGEAALVDEAIAADQAEYESRRPEREAQAAAAGFGPASGEERTEWDRRREELERVYASGRPAKATVVSNEDTGRTLNNIPVILVTLDVQGRRVVYEHVWGPRHAKRYKPGKTVDVRVDPGDSGVIALA